SGIGGSIGILNASTSREDVNRETILYTSGSIYVSFIMNVTASGGTTGDYFFHLIDSSGLTTGTTFRSRLFVKDGSTAGTYKLGITKGSAAAFATFTATDYPLNVPVLVVMKHTFNPSNPDSSYAYVFTSGIPTSEPTSATIFTNTPSDIAIADLTKVKSIAFRQGTVGVAAITIDGIRVADSWGNSALPVKLVSFSASLNNNQTELNWSTASETNNKGFEVERSIDGVNFETIGFVKGNGNSNSMNKYSFIDANQSSAYYRLKQIDFDGKFEYSSTVKVNSDELLVDLTPNPFNDNLVINSPTIIENAEIIDVTGKVKLMEIVNSNKATINTSTLSNGIYFIRINNGQKVITKRIIKN
ncbi:MAG: T9SS type A sorting domain-containing protein, partial [Bacteroidia bacterium]|nr:T9SS type A sorting domain-containing protein [Bacteroidia bacterium]